MVWDNPRFRVGAKFKCSHISFYFAFSDCHSQILNFYKLKVCGKVGSSKTIGAIFPTMFAHLISLCHILVILIILQTFHYYYICYSDLWFVIFMLPLLLFCGTVDHIYITWRTYLLKWQQKTYINVVDKVLPIWLQFWKKSHHG